MGSTRRSSCSTDLGMNLGAFAITRSTLFWSRLRFSRWLFAAAPQIAQPVWRHRRQRGRWRLMEWWGSRLCRCCRSRAKRIDPCGVPAAMLRTLEEVEQLSGHASRLRGERMLNSCVMHLQTGSAPGIMVWGGIGYHSRTPLVCIAGTLNSHRYISEVLEPVVLPYLQGLSTAIFQQDNPRPHVARIVQRLFVNHQIELLPWPTRSPDFSPIENMWSMVAQRLAQITPSAATPDQLWQRVEAAWSAAPQEHIQSLFESMLRHVTAVISNNGDYSGY
ncbi:transposable element Tcb1 transposase [Trichonephila clavipes]|nr:transposable element Tcb1 transposase [Trichonephila clavipes]